MSFEIPDRKRIPAIDDFPNFLRNQTHEISEKVREVLSEKFERNTNGFATIEDDLFLNYSPSMVALYYIAVNSNDLKIKEECVSCLLDHYPRHPDEFYYLYKIAYDVQNAPERHIDSDFEEAPLYWVIFLKMIRLIKSGHLPFIYPLEKETTRTMLTEIWQWMPIHEASDFEFLYKELHDLRHPLKWEKDNIEPNSYIKAFCPDLFQQIADEYNLFGKS